MVCNIMHGIGGLKKEAWFEMAQDRGNGIMSGAGPLNIRLTSGKLEGPLNIRLTSGKLDIRRNFFSNRVIDAWYKIPREIKNARNVKMCKSQYRKLRERS